MNEPTKLPVPHRHKKRISSIVGGSIFFLSFFLLSVCGASWLGLESFQTSLAKLSEESLPKVMETSTASTYLSHMLVSAEHIVHVKNKSELRIAYKELSTTMAEANAFFAAWAFDDSENVKQQMIVLGGFLDRLHSLVGERLKTEVHIDGLMKNIDELTLDIIKHPDFYSAKKAGDQKDEFHVLYLQLIRIMSDAQHEWSNRDLSNLLQLAKTVDKDLKKLAGTADNSADDSLVVFGNFTKKVTGQLLGKEGYIEALRSLMRTNSEIKSMHSVCRGMMNEMRAARVTLFNDMIFRSATVTQKARADLNFFAQFFISAALMGILLPLTMYLYLRRSFISRLENLNKGVLRGVEGKWKDIRVGGGDEIATIAESVNYFARELSISTRMAEASNKAKSSFLANMSHEIRTPMNAIIGFSRMVAGTKLDDVQKNFVHKIESSAKFLLGIINDILDFSKIEAGKLDVENVPLELPTIIENVSASCEQKAEAKGLHFQVSIDEKLPTFFIGDPVRIFQILNNLCDNAVKFTTEGTVLLKVSLVEEKDESYDVAFTVHDEGIGLTDEQINKLFQPFTQADTSTTRRFGGTGLGLTICKSLCELMGGSIGIQSEFGKGSTFFFTLPLGKCDEQAAKSLSSGKTDSTCNLKGLKLLLVEDNAINQEIILALLESTEAETVIAGNGAEALERVNADSFDMILMDIQMPVMDGMEATTLIRALPEGHDNRDIPIIAMTAHVMSDDVRKCLAAGMNDHIAKPIEPEVLYSILNKWNVGSASGVGRGSASPDAPAGA